MTKLFSCSVCMLCCVWFANLFPVTFASFFVLTFIDSFGWQWGGISSEEHDEAIMLEAALFGGLPRFGSSDVRLPFQPHQSDDGVINADTSNCFDIFDTGRPFQLPPSPSVVEQRRLREEQVSCLSFSLDTCECANWLWVGIFSTCAFCCLLLMWLDLCFQCLRNVDDHYV